MFDVMRLFEWIVSMTASVTILPMSCDLMSASSSACVFLSDSSRIPSSLALSAAANPSAFVSTDTVISPIGDDMTMSTRLNSQFSQRNLQSDGEIPDSAMARFIAWYLSAFSMIAVVRFAVYAELPSNPTNSPDVGL